MFPKDCWYVACTPDEIQAMIAKLQEGAKAAVEAVKSSQEISSRAFETTLCVYIARLLRSHP